MTVDLDRLAASRAVQGLPPKLTDPVAIRKLAVLFSAPAVPVDACTPPQRPRASAGARGSETKSEGRRANDDPRSEAAG